MTPPDINAIRAALKAAGLKANVRIFDKVGSGNFRIVFPHLRDLPASEYWEALQPLLPKISAICRQFGLFTVMREQDVSRYAFQCASIFLYYKLHGYRVAPQA